MENKKEIQRRVRRIPKGRIPSNHLVDFKIKRTYTSPQQGALNTKRSWEVYYNDELLEVFKTQKMAKEYVIEKAST